MAKLEEIKPHIDAWWDSGAQSIQLLADGEVDMLPIWNGRIEVLKEERSTYKEVRDALAAVELPVVVTTEPEGVTVYINKKTVAEPMNHSVVWVQPHEDRIANLVPHHVNILH